MITISTYCYIIYGLVVLLSDPGFEAILWVQLQWLKYAGPTEDMYVCIYAYSYVLL